MNITPQARADADLAQSARASTVILGRQDYVSTLLRLIGMELYKIRRRTMSKVLGSIAVVAAVLVFLFLSIGTLYVSNLPLTAFQASCQQSQQVNGTPQSGPAQPPAPSSNCPQLSTDELTLAKQQALQSVSEPLRLPTSLHVAVQVALTPFTVLIIILMGAVAGGEFSIGTVRLLFSRGPTRAQFFLAKYGAAIACTAIGLFAMAIIGVLAGQALNPLSGIAQGFDFFTWAWLGHAILFLLAAMLNWFIYAAMAIFFGILGRSTVAGVVGAITWFFAESILASALSFVGTLLIQGSLGDFLRAIPDYFIGNNIGALLQNQEQYIFGTQASSLSDLHAVIVLAVYLAIFIGLAWWLNEKRDITN